MQCRPFGYQECGIPKEWSERTCENVQWQNCRSLLGYEIANTWGSAFVPANMDANVTDLTLRSMVDAIVDNDAVSFTTLLKVSPLVATVSFSGGATREHPSSSFIESIGHYIYSGDTALHFAAASYRQNLAIQLVAAGANVRAKNRRGAEPLHAAAFGSPGSTWWNPEAQASTIVYLIEAGADANARTMDGVTPLHCAVRTRCASAVKALLEHGADPAIRNKNGSTAMQIASRTTGRSGSGSAEAKMEQQQILRLLQR